MRARLTRLWRSLRGYEAMNMIRKGQIQGIEKGDIKGQAEYARSIFRSCCITRADCEDCSVLKKLRQHNLY